MTHPKTSSRLNSLLCCSAVMLGSVGCGISPSHISSSTATNPPSAGTLIATGNWQGNLSPGAGKASLGAISGSIDQSGGTTSAGQFTTSVFRISNPCFANTPIPAQGFVKDSAVSLNSFAVEHQYVVLTGTVTSGGTSVNGNYVVYGGCSDGNSGDFTIQRYAPFTGAYASTDTQTHNIGLTVTQSDGADGSGAFPMAASGTFGGFECFSQGTAMASDAPMISGASFTLLFTTNERSGSTLRLAGTINQDASRVLSYSYLVSGGQCDGANGTGTLTRK